jgi:hypothetical protein
MQDVEALYRDNGRTLPQGLSEQIEATKWALEALTPESLAASQAEMRQAGEVLSVLQEALRAGIPQKIEEAARKVRELYGPDAGNARELAQLTGLDLMAYSVRNPPFILHGNSRVSWTLNTAGALLTTFLATKMLVLTLRPGLNWPELLAETAVDSLAMYGGAFAAQYLLVKSWNEVAKAREQWRKRRAEAELGGATEFVELARDSGPPSGLAARGPFSCVDIFSLSLPSPEGL